jgi:hypothetical protein
MVRLRALDMAAKPLGLKTDASRTSLPWEPSSMTQRHVRGN